MKKRISYNYAASRVYAIASILVEDEKFGIGEYPMESAVYRAGCDSLSHTELMIANDARQAVTGKDLLCEFDRHLMNSRKGRKKNLEKAKKTLIAIANEIERRSRGETNE